MMPFLILAFSLVALVRFGISQWRAIWVSAANQRLSDSLQLSTGIDGSAIGPQDFGKVKDLYDRLSPELKKTSSWLGEVSIYYGIIARLEEVCRLKLTPIATWASREMQLCSRYAAVVLDQNLSMNFDRQLADRGL